MKALEILKQARDLIAKPLGWTQHEYKSIKLDKRGHAHDCFCALGALDAVNCGGPYAYSEAQSYLRAVLPDSFRSIIIFNDDAKTTRKDVLACFDRAIKLARKEARKAKNAPIGPPVA